MSLEAALKEHTEVMRELLARLTARNITSTMSASDYVATLPKDASGALAGSTTEADMVDKVKAAQTSAPDAATQIKAGAAQAAAAADLDYEKDVRPLLVKISTAKGRDALVELLGKFGVAKGDQLKPGQLGQVVAEAKAILEA